MYRVLDLEFFANEIRKGVLESNDMPDDEESITTRQVIELAEMHCIRDEDGYLSSDEIVQAIMEEVQDIVIGFMLVRMVVAGELESAWDSEKNEAVFWVPSSDL